MTIAADLSVADVLWKCLIIWKLSAELNVRTTLILRKGIIDNLLIEGVNFVAVLSANPISVVSILIG